MRKEFSHWYVDGVCRITNTVIYGILTSLPFYSGSCFERKSDFIIGLVLTIDPAVKRSANCEQFLMSSGGPMGQRSKSTAKAGFSVFIKTMR